MHLGDKMSVAALGGGLLLLGSMAIRSSMAAGIDSPAAPDGGGNHAAPHSVVCQHEQRPQPNPASPDDRQTALAAELLEEQNWVAARREAQLVLLRDPDNETAQQILTLAAQAEHGQALPPRRGGLFALPGEAIVAFYRSYVSPAIGARCSLTPSCSQLFLEASRKHGLLAFPIIADRLVREPGVVAEARHKVIVGREIRIADPLEDHDGWLSDSKSKGRKGP